MAELADLLGVSRQLCLYHVKKYAAVAGCVLVLEPCAENGGLRFRVWNAAWLAVWYRRAA